MKRCEYCGAHIDKNVAKCPYCDHFNYEGAEKEYMDKMDDITEDLEGLKEEIKSSEHINKELKKEQKKISKLVVIILVSIGMFIGSCVLCGVIGNFTMESLDQKEQDEAMKLREIHYPVLNKLIKEKDYEELSKYFHEQYELNDEFYKCLYDWKYSGILYMASCYYNQYPEMTLPTEKEELIEYLDEYDYEYRNYMESYFEMYEYVVMTDGKFEEHQEFVDTVRKVAEEKIESFGLTATEKENLENYATHTSYEVSFYDLSKMIIERKVKEANEM